MVNKEGGVMKMVSMEVRELIVANAKDRTAVAESRGTIRSHYTPDDDFS